MRSCAASLAAGVVAEYELPRRVHVLVPKVLGIGMSGSSFNSTRIAERTPERVSLRCSLIILGLTGSRGGKLSDRFRMARERLLPDGGGVDLHFFLLSYFTIL